MSADNSETIVSKTMPGMTCSFHADFTWCLYLRGFEVKLNLHELGLPVSVKSLLDVQGLLNKVEDIHLCTGHPDDRYQSLITSKMVVGCFRLVDFYVAFMHNNHFKYLIRNVWCTLDSYSTHFSQRGVICLCQSKCCLNCVRY